MNIQIHRSVAIACAVIFSSAVAWPQSRIAIDRLAPGRLTVSGVAGIYEIQWATNLETVTQTTTNAPMPGLVTNPAFWQSLGVITVTSAPAQFTDSGGIAAPYCFYRTKWLSMIPTNGPSSPRPVELAWIPAGTFVMGSPTNEAGRDADEVQHVVTLTRGVYMAKYETTQREYLRVMSNNPSWFSSAYGYPENLDRPVEWVSWRDATNFCGRLNALEGAAGRLPAGWAYRLPTEAEWEYACRAGTVMAYNVGAVLSTNMANFGSRYGQTTTAGSFSPNAWGLYDMHGNVMEWCLDRYEAYPEGSVVDPQGPATGLFRVLRGGHWASAAASCRSAYRYLDFGDTHSKYYGFRYVLAQSN